jgi:hypothetical protein
MKTWKVQKFFGDIVYDLRSRGLLPVVILLVVAMVGVPILISRGSSSSSSSLQPTGATAPTAQTARETEQAVVSYSPPGLRDYKRRLNGLSPKDPFRQPAGQAESVAAASQLSSVAPASSATVSAPPSGSTSSSAPVSTGSSTGSGTVTHHQFLIRSVADVSFGDVTQPLERHKHLKNFASLPNQAGPVLIYLGSTLDQKKAVFSLSKSASQVTGDGTCAPSPDDCTLLAVAPEHTADMVYAVDGKTYRVKVNDIRLVRKALGS